MKYLLLLPLLIALTSCGTVTPYGALLAGTDADHIVVEGNAQTGAYRMEATGLNQSKSTDRVVQGVENVTQIKAMSEVGKELIGEGAPVIETALQ